MHQLMDNPASRCVIIGPSLAREYRLPEVLNVSFHGLLPGLKCPEKFIEVRHEHVSEGAVQVNWEMTKTDITLLAPCLGDVGTCTWFDEGGHRYRGDKAGELQLMSHMSHRVTCGVRQSSLTPVPSRLSVLGCLAFPVRYMPSDLLPGSSAIPPSLSSSKLNKDAV
jgi:hypothetical protein